MPRGRKPDPPGLQAIKGDPRKQKRQTAGAHGSPDLGAGGSLKPLSKLTPAAQAVWRELGPELERLNFLRPTDRNAFARYCDAVVRYWDVSKSLRKEGQTYTSTSQHGELRRVNPLFLIEERLAKRLEGLEDRFGLTPATRQQIMARLASAQHTLPLGGGGGASDQPPEPPEAPADSPVGFLGAATRH